MQIDAHLILELENLAKLQLGAAERTQRITDLNRRQTMAENLIESNTGSVEPLSYVLSVSDNFRSGKDADQLSTGDALKNAPETEGNWFKVPK